MQPAAKSNPVIAALLTELENRPDYRWTEADISRLGFDPSAVRRSFNLQFGMTFLEMARQRRLRDGFVTLRAGDRGIEAQIDAGFSSGSAFREAFARLLGRPPSSFGPNGLLLADWVETPLGDMIAVCSKSHLHLLEFVERKALKTELGKLSAAVKGDIGIGKTVVSDQLKSELGAFFAGRSACFKTPLAFHGSTFTQEV